MISVQQMLRDAIEEILTIFVFSITHLILNVNDEKHTFPLFIFLLFQVDRLICELH